MLPNNYITVEHFLSYLKPCMKYAYFKTSNYNNVAAMNLMLLLVIIIINDALLQLSPSNLSQHVLEILIDISKYLLSLSSGTPLLKHLFDYILFNPELWSRADPAVSISFCPWY